MLKTRDVQNEEDLDLCCYYGTPFEPLEDNEKLVTKPTPLHEQIATDNRGRQRFHGAFTGGFSAGFFNSVGSKEGFEPATFVSSRSDRCSSKKYSAKDFMDDEDLNEFGIAPKHLKVSDDFCTTERQESLGSLENRIVPNPFDLGARLLNRLGVRHGKGVGADVNRHLNFGRESETDEMQACKVYTCARPPPEYDLSFDSLDDEQHITQRFRLAPEDVNIFISESHKTDRKGLGFDSLNPNRFLSGSSFTVSNTVSGMKGQAFGVGAFEEDDDDIYAQENMNDYDFELGPSKPSDKRSAHEIGIGINEGFVKATLKTEVFEIVTHHVPTNYKPRLPESLRNTIISVSKNEPEKKSDNLQMKSVQIKITDQKLPLKGKPEINNTASGSNFSKAETLEWSNHNEKDPAGDVKKHVFPQNTNLRFVSAGKLDTLSSRVAMEDRPETSREKAARLKMFGKLTRTTSSCKFTANVCKRFNVKATVENSITEATVPVNKVFSPFLTPQFNLSDLNFTQQKPKFDAVNIKGEIEILPNPAVTVDPEVTEATVVTDEYNSEAQKEDSKGEVLESLKNFNLLADVFGDESDDEEETASTLKVSNEEIQDLAKQGQVSASAKKLPEENYEKFFQLPSSIQSSEKTQVETENSKITPVDDEEDFGPSLPPEMMNQPDNSKSNPSIGDVDDVNSNLSFFQDVYDKVKKKKRKKHKRHKGFCKDE